MPVNGCALNRSCLHEIVEVMTRAGIWLARCSLISIKMSSKRHSSPPLLAKGPVRDV